MIERLLEVGLGMLGFEERREDPIGRIRGVSVVTFQYFRMMGGIDTVVPDKIVKKVINGILVKAGYEPVDDDIMFVKKTEEIALTCEYRPIELCWVTWLIQPEGKKMRMKNIRMFSPRFDIKSTAKSS
ncbi:MAG: hypothetical protein ACTSXW_06080 [Candidatus Baldrarchaeia archaeon]